MGAGAPRTEPNVLSLGARLFADPNGSPALIRRLLAEHARSHWRAYAISLTFMAVGAACTASAAYLIGHGINEAYVARSFQGVALVSVAAIVIFTIKGFTTYGQAVMLARISNSILAHNQRRMFDKLLAQNVGFFADRHSSEFAARITFGAGAASQALSLIVNTLGRDLLSLIALIGVMVWQAPLLSLIGLVVMPPAVLTVRKLIKRVRAITRTQYGGGADILKTMQETIQGFKVIKAFNLEEIARGQVYEASPRWSARRTSSRGCRTARRR